MIPHLCLCFLQSCNKSLINQACSGPYWKNIGPRSFLYGPSAARSVLSRPRADILPVRPSRLVNKIYLFYLRSIYSGILIYQMLDFNNLLIMWTKQCLCWVCFIVILLLVFLLWILNKQSRVWTIHTMSQCSHESVSYCLCFFVVFFTLTFGYLNDFIILSHYSVVVLCHRQQIYNHSLIFFQLMNICHLHFNTVTYRPVKIRGNNMLGCFEMLCTLKRGFPSGCCRTKASPLQQTK